MASVLFSLLAETYPLWQLKKIQLNSTRVEHKPLWTLCYQFLERIDYMYSSIWGYTPTVMMNFL